MLSWIWASEVALVVKKLPAYAWEITDTGSIPGWGRAPRVGGAWLPSPVFLPGKSLGQSSLVFYSSQGCKRVRHGWSELVHAHGNWVLFFYWQIFNFLTEWLLYLFTTIQRCQLSELSRVSKLLCKLTKTIQSNCLLGMMMIWSELFKEQIHLFITRLLCPA